MIGMPLCAQTGRQDEAGPVHVLLGGGHAPAASVRGSSSVAELHDFLL
jgi:hypothetical protein